MLHSMTNTLPEINYMSCCNVAPCKSTFLCSTIYWQCCQNWEEKMHTHICVWLKTPFKRILKTIVIRSNESYAQKVMMLAFKLQKNAAYAILTSSQHLYKKFTPRSAHAVANNLSVKLDQSKVRCYNYKKLGYILRARQKPPQPGPIKLPPIKRVKLTTHLLDQ